MKLIFAITACIITLLCCTSGSRALAGDASPGYCLRCHPSPPALTLGSLDWRGPVASEREHPCPGVSRIKEELYLTQSLLFTAGKVLKQSHLEGKGESWQELMRLKARFRQSLNRPVWSLSQVIQGQSALRQELTRRILAPAWQRQERANQRGFWGLAALVFAFLALCSLFMYFKHKRGMSPAQAQALPQAEAAEGDQAGAVDGHDDGAPDEG